MIWGVPQIDAESYILIDYNSGKVLAEQNADVRRDPASLTKMMTSYVFVSQKIKSRNGMSVTDGIAMAVSSVWITITRMC